MVCAVEWALTPRPDFASQDGNYSEKTCVDSLIIVDVKEISLIQNVAENNDLAG